MPRTAEPLQPRKPSNLQDPLQISHVTAALDAGVPLRDVQEAASHADPRTTMRYDRASGWRPTTTTTTCSIGSPPQGRSQPGERATTAAASGDPWRAGPAWS